MRIRQVKPAFWTDAVMAAMPPATRLFYVGLWMVADDGGWFRWDVPEIANELYGYETRSRRERNVAAFLDALDTAGRVLREPGCIHATIPRFVIHQRFAGSTKQVHTIEVEHKKECPPRVPAGSRTSPQVPARIGTVTGEGEEGNVSGSQGSGRAGEPDGPRPADVIDWDARVAETRAKGAS